MNRLSSSLRQCFSTIKRAHARSKGTFTCDEEPIVLKGTDGYGYFPGSLGQRLDGDRFEIVRKLGWGQFSSVWLAHDDLLKRYVALKILTYNATAGVNSGRLGELTLSQRVTDANPRHAGYPYCSHLLHHFTTTSKAGKHLCLVGDVLGTTVTELRLSNPNKYLPLPLVKRIVKQTLLALDYIHTECKIIHTDLKPDNMLLYFADKDKEMSEYISANPSKSYPLRYEPGLSPDPILTVVSQPLPNFGLKSDGSNLHVKLTDFGHSTWIDKHFDEEVQPTQLRAPEVILGYPWSTPIDIWTLGCLTFEFVTGRYLFDPAAGPSWKMEDDHLARMIDLADGSFKSDMLLKSTRSDEFFKSDGSLIRIQVMLPNTVEECIQNYKCIPDGDLHATANFIKRCIKLHPEDRPTAAELLEDDWLQY